MTKGSTLSRSSVTNQVSKWSVIGAVLASLLLLLFFARVYWGKDTRPHFVQFFIEDTPNLHAYYGSQIPKLIEVDDGIVGYATGYPTLSWLGFTLDVQGVEAKRKGRLLDLAVARGYDRLASVNYFNAKGLDASTPSDVIKDKLGKTFFLSPKEVAAYSFQVEYVSKRGSLSIIHVTPQPAGSNLVSNSSFEKDTGGWLNVTKVSFERSGEIAYDGGFAAHAVTSGIQGVGSANISVESGARYLMGAWVKVTKGAARLQVKADNGSQLAEDHVYVTKEWYHLSALIDIPPGVQTVQVILDDYHEASDFYVDLVEFRKQQ